MATKKKSDEAAPASLEELLRKPAVKAFFDKQVKKSDIEVRLGPGASGWAYGNNAKRGEIEDLNAALHALAEIAST